ncbi:MAG: hypothetical protein HRU06_15400 [Oceanospirillaceae bacterium]|nr:hypothetical protein [Oceanospirillaceae bacterium]
MAEFCSRQILSTCIPAGTDFLLLQILSTCIPAGNGKNPLWFGFFLPTGIVGKGREQDAEALPTGIVGKGREREVRPGPVWFRGCVATQVNEKYGTASLYHS